MKISVTVDQIQNDLTRLVDFTTGEYAFNMPTRLLPSDIREKDILEFEIINNKQRKKEQQETVKDLLQDLMQGKHLR